MRANLLPFLLLPVVTTLGCAAPSSEGDARQLHARAVEAGREGRTNRLELPVEVCDGLDNDDDGLVDEGFDADADAIADCFDVEECDGLDNDGDGALDEGYDADGDEISDCFDLEECDGLDNDGDGLVDEGYDVDGDDIVDCTDAEECDGLDNDGDGLVDEGFDLDADGVADCLEEIVCGGVIGGVDVGVLPQYLFLFADARTDGNWQGATKGFAGDVAVNGKLAKERTSGSVPYAGTIYTNNSTLDAWQKIVDQSVNAGQAFGVTDEVDRLTELESTLYDVFDQIDALPVTTGYASRTPTSLDGLDTTDGVATTYVIDITSSMKVSTSIDITGDAGDVFVLRWDSDADANNGYQGQVKFQSGGAIVPHGGLTAANFLHVAGDINASGGGSTPAAPFPQGPRLDDGLGALINGGSDFNGGGFFTGYWFTTGAPSTGESSSLSNAIFVGGWYSIATKFSMTSGTSGVHVCP